MIAQSTAVHFAVTRPRRPGAATIARDGLYSGGRIERADNAVSGAGRIIVLAALCAGGFRLPAALAQATQPVDMREKLDARQNELREARDSLRLSEEQRRALESELEFTRNDRARLNSALIDTGARARAAEERIAGIEQRLETSIASESAIRKSLEARRGVVAEVLAALQRMGRKPPPAVLVSPGDMLGAIRMSMLLGAVVPELRAETQALAADLADLVLVRQSITTERDNLGRELESLASERIRLSALVDSRQKSLAETEQALQSERGRAQELARQASDLKDLVARMEAEISSAGKAAEAARKSDEAQRKAALENPTRVAAGPFRDPARLAPAIPFAETRGLLPMPAAGAVAKPFGAPDGLGGVEKGLSLAVRPGASVASPTDGWVVFSGPWRSYGQLLIINAGGGYYVVLAGMERINVEVRQFVLAGEPVGTMGEGSAKTAATIAVGATQPVLYVEFRKDGVSIDPGPWWARPEQEKVRG